MARIFAKGRDTGIAQAYREPTYRLHEIAAQLGVHNAEFGFNLNYFDPSNLLILRLPRQRAEGSWWAAVFGGRFVG